MSPQARALGQGSPSLVRRISASMTVIFLLAFPLVTGIFAILSTRNAYKAALSEGDRLGTYLEGLLPEPLWQLDTKTIKSLGETLVRQGAVSYLLISDNQAGVIFRYGEPGSGKELREVELAREGSPIGHVSFSMDYGSYLKEVGKLVSSILTTGASIFVVLLVAIRIAIIRELARPIQGVTRLLQSYDAGAPSPIIPSRLGYEEFLPLIRQITAMGGTISAQMGELRELNADLGRRVAERTAELEKRNEELAAERDRVAHYLAIADEASKAKSEFLATMSHELRTPLNAVLGFSQLIAKKRGLDEDTRRKAELVNESGKHLLSIINDILDVSRIEARKFELLPSVFSLREAVLFVEAMLRPKAEEKGLALGLDFEDEAPEAVKGDERRIKQILINLGNNAIKFTSAGWVRLRASYREGIFSFSVEDSGQGIPQDRLESLFKPFERVRNKSEYVEGAGLGLAISKSLALVMGGDIQVRSQEGTGSTFTLTLPLPKEEGSTAQAHDGVNPAGYEGQRKKILVVDDNPYNATFFISLLSPLGFLVSTVSDGMAALQAARGESFDLILLDYRLPGSNGIATVTALRAEAGRDRRPPIVGISASLGGLEGEGAFAEACDDYLRKPVEGAELLAVIGKHLDLEWTGVLEGEGRSSLLADPVQEGASPKGPVPREAILDMLEGVKRGDYTRVEAALDTLEKAGWAESGLARRLVKRYDDEGLERLLAPFVEGLG